MLMAEFATCVKYRLPVKVFIIKNNTLGQIKWEQMVFLGNPEYGCELHPINFALFAEACGGTGLRFEDPKDCGRVVEQALNMGALIVEAVVDPFEPPMPPKITTKQAQKFAESLLRRRTESRKDHRDGGGGSYSRTGLASVVGTVGATALNRTSGNSGNSGSDRLFPIFPSKIFQPEK